MWRTGLSLFLTRILSQNVSSLEEVATGKSPIALNQHYKGLFMYFTTYLTLLLAMNPQTSDDTKQVVVEINGKKGNTISLKVTGSTAVTRLSSGVRVSILMKNGKPEEAFAVDEHKNALKATVGTVKNSTVISITVWRQQEAIARIRLMP